MGRSLKSPFSKDVYRHNASMYKVLAHPTRLEILNIIKTKEATVEDLARTVGVTDSNACQHLSILRHIGVVRVRRVGQHTLYRLADARIVEPCNILRRLNKRIPA